MKLSSVWKRPLAWAGRSNLSTRNLPIRLVRTKMEASAGIYSQGPNTLSVNRAELHGKTRSKVLDAMKTAIPEGQNGIILLQGGGPFNFYNTDMEGIFRQEGYFHYLFGVQEEGYYGALDLRTKKAHLFMPRLPDSYAVWMGKIRGTDDVRLQYAVDSVSYVDEMPQVLEKLAPPVIYLLDGMNSDSGVRTPAADFEGIGAFKVDRDALHPVITECRVKKTEEELAVMRYSSRVGSAAHVDVLRDVRPGKMEYECEATFQHSCYSKGGARLMAYTPICASGPNGATLHYGHAAAPNDRQIQDGDMMLLDMGCKYYGYDSDITCSYPANGKFSPLQRTVYEAVLNAHQSVIAAMRPGVSWPDMHRLAEHCILTGLKEGGFLVGDVGEMVEQRVGALFMPHGLGHLLGIETHDVGGYLPGCPPRIDLPGLRSLRTARVLEAGMVITVEPGCYFNDFLLLPAFKSPEHGKFLVKEKIETLLGFGGVRIEDNVIVTSDGAESMTDVPRSVADIESVWAGGPWPVTP